MSAFSASLGHTCNDISLLLISLTFNYKSTNTKHKASSAFQDCLETTATSYSFLMNFHYTLQNPCLQSLKHSRGSKGDSKPDQNVRSTWNGALEENPEEHFQQRNSLR